MYILGILMTKLYLRPPHALPTGNRKINLVFERGFYNMAVIDLYSEE